MSTHADSKPWTVPGLALARAGGQRLVMLTAYDATFARVCDHNGVDLILVGDSLGMITLGYSGTIPVTMEGLTTSLGSLSILPCFWSLTSFALT